MANFKEFESDQAFENEVRSAYQAQDPDQLFVDRLGKKLVDRYKEIDRSVVIERPRWQDKLNLVLSPLGWWALALILILFLTWGIKTLLPRFEPVENIQATPLPAVSQSTPVAPVLAEGDNTISTLPVPAEVITAANASQITNLASWGKEPIYKVIWAPDGNSFAVATATKIHIYDRATFNKIRTIDNGTDASMAYSPDGTKLATGYNNGSVKIWDVASGKPILTLEGHKNFISHLTFSPNGEILASGAYQEPLKLWDVQSGQELLTVGDVTTNNFVFSPDGTLLATSGGEDKTVRLWDVTSGQEVRDFTGHTDFVYGLAFSLDGKSLASTSNDMTIKLWDIATGNEVQTFTDQAFLYSVDFLPDGETLISVAEGEPIKLWDIASAQVQRTVGEGIEGGMISLSPDGTMVLHYSWGGDAIRLLDIARGKELGSQELTNEVGKLDWQTYPATSLAISPDGHILAVGLASGGIKLLDATNGQEIRSLSGHTKEVGLTKEVRSLDFSPDGKLLASSAPDGTSRIWDVATGNELSTIDGVPEIGWSGGEPSVDFSQDGKLLAIAGPMGRVKVWDVTNQVDLRTLGGVPDGSHPDDVGGVAISPDGKTIASGYASASITLWDVSSGQELRTLSYSSSQWLTGVSELEFSPDGKTLAVGYGDANVILWEVASGKKLFTLAFFWEDEITDLDFSPDGDVLAVGSGMASMALLDVASGKELIDLASPANGVVFSPDGKLLISGSYEGGIKLWGIPVENVTQPEVTELPSEAVLTAPEVALPTSEELNIEKTPIPTLLTANNLQGGEWSPDGSYFYYTQQGPIGDPGPDQAVVTVSFLDALSGETCEGEREIVNIIDDEFGAHPEGAELRERVRFLGDNRLLYLSLDGELMALTPCSGPTENWSSSVPDTIVSLPYTVKSDGSQVLLQGEQAYWLFEPATGQSLKLNVPVPLEGMKTRIGWLPGEEKLYYSRNENRDGLLWMTIESIDPSTGVASMLYEVQVSDPSAGIQWIDKDLAYIYSDFNSGIQGDKLIDLSTQPAQELNVSEIFGITSLPAWSISAYGATHSNSRQDYHLMLVTGMVADGQYYLYHPESGVVDQYPLDPPLLVVFPDGGGGLEKSFENQPSANVFRVILVDTNTQPYELVVKGHDVVQGAWSFASILPGAKQVVFNSLQGISLVDLASGEILSFWGYEGQEQYQDIYSILSPDGKTVVSIANLKVGPGEATIGQAMFWLRLEP